MRNKIIKISAVVLAIALLFGGIFLLFRDDVNEMIQEEKIKPLSPSTIFRAFNELEKHKLLKRFPRYHIHGGRRSSLYKIKGEIGVKKDV